LVRREPEPAARHGRWKIIFYQIVFWLVYRHPKRRWLEKVIRDVKKMLSSWFGTLDNSKNLHLFRKVRLFSMAMEQRSPRKMVIQIHHLLLQNSELTFINERIFEISTLRNTWIIPTLSWWSLL
jgi:hypothetical protein